MGEGEAKPSEESGMDKNLLRKQEKHLKRAKSGLIGMSVGALKKCIRETEGKIATVTGRHATEKQRADQLQVKVSQLEGHMVAIGGHLSDLQLLAKQLNTS